MGSSVTRHVPWVSASVILLVSLPMLATAPQGADGAELVSAAQFGGVLHPPGFPVQAWLDLLLIRAPWGAPASRIALLSAFAHAGTVFVIAATLRLLCASALGVLAGALAYGLFAPAWYLGEQPEVFSLAFLALAGVLFQLVWLAARAEEAPAVPAPGRAGLRHAVSAGLLFGVAVAVHPIAAVGLPAFLCSTWISSGVSSEKAASSGGSLRRLRSFLLGRSFWVACLVAVAVSGLLYASLLLLSGRGVWPDWGKLRTAKDLAAHVLRVDFGTWRLSGVATSASGLRGLTVAGRELLKNWTVLLPFVAVGAVHLGSGTRSATHGGAVSVGVLGTAALSMLLLYRAQFVGDSDYSRAILERFAGSLALPLSVVLGVGVDAGLEAVSHAAARAFLAGVVATAVIWMGIHSRAQANAREDRTLDVFMQSVGLALPQDALWVAGQSEEYFRGIPSASGLRFPVLQGSLLGSDWYWHQVLSHIEPRIPTDRVGPLTIEQVMIVSAKWGMGTVASLDGKIFARTARVAEIRGPLLVSDPEVSSDVSQRTCRAACDLCPLVATLGALPPGGHGFSRQLRRALARGYLGAERWLRANHKPFEALSSRRVAQGLVESDDPNSWRVGCVNLTRSAVCR